MAKNENKIKETKASVANFLAGVENDEKRNDCYTIARIMEEITGEVPKMWGPSIIGFGSFKYVYKSGREGEWMLTGFSPRKQALTLYIMSGLEKEESLLANLGKYKTGKSCLYVKRLSDVNEEALRELIRVSVEKTRAGDIKY
ncbi:MAG: DUF1801 domain-containing protein [Bacteroidota bacterium]